MTPDTWKTIDFIRFYVMALLRGSPVELMRQRYPEWEFDVGPDHFSLRKKLVAPVADPVTEPPAAPTLTTPQPAEPSTPAAPAPLLNVT